MLSRFMSNKLGMGLLFAAIIFIMLHIHLFNPKQENPFDAGENLAAAYTVARYNTFSINLDPHPASKREPFFSFIMGMAIKVKNVFIKHSVDLSSQTIEQINRFKIINIAILFATIVWAAWFVWLRTQNYFLTGYAALTLIFSAALAESAHTFCTEVFAAFLCLGVALLLYLAKAYENRRSYYVYLAIFISALTLTKATYLYFIPFIFIYLLTIHSKKIKQVDKNFIKNFLILVCIIATLVGGWMWRNYHYFGRFMVSERREVINSRAGYDAIFPAEYPYLYAVWAPGLSKYFLTEDTKPNWTRLVNRLGNDQVFLEVYQHQIADFFRGKQRNPSGSYDQSEYIALENIAIQYIIHHPWDHIKLSLAFLYRSIFIEDGSGLEYLGFHFPHEDNYDKRVDSFLLAVLVNVPVWLCFFYLIYYSIRYRDAAVLGLWLLPAYAVLVYALLVFSHPRYLLPLVPILTVISCLAVAAVIPACSKRGSSVFPQKALGPAVKPRDDNII